MRQRRDALAYTRPELAACVGCSVSALRKIEADERRPSRQLAELLAGCLQLAEEEKPRFLKVARGTRLVARLGPPAEIAAGAAVSAPWTGVASNLPSPATTLVGREAELATLVQLLDDSGCRLLTLVGPGGIGKTRLATEVASNVRNHFVDGAFFVSLAATSAGDFIVPAIAQAIKLSFSGPADPRSQLVHYLSNKQMLLLLDNVEQLLDWSEAVAALLAGAPGLKILVTSRDRLQLSGEWVFEVQGLPVPRVGEVEGVEKYSAFQLFLQRAHQAKVDFELDREEYVEVVRICRLVEGMPLALELAAAWIPVLSCREIALEIETGLDILATRRRDVPVRQRSMRAVFEYSWQMLATDEQRVFCQLAVFRGGFTRRAAEMVAGARLDGLRALVGKSLLTTNREGRYGIHELLRQFVEEKLVVSGEAEVARSAHSRYFLEQLRVRQPDLEGADQLAALRAIAADFENYHAAWEWAVAVATEELVVAGARSLHLFFNLLSRYYEGIAFFQLAVERFQPESGSRPGNGWRHLVPYLLYVAAITGTATDNMAQDVELCLELARAEDDRSRMADCLAGLACYMMFVKRDIARAILLGEQSLAHFRALGDYAGAGWLMLWLSSFYEQDGRPGVARAFAEESLQLALTTGNKVGVPFVLNNFAVIALSTGDYVAAERYYHQTLQLAQEMEHWQMVAAAQTGLTILHLFHGEVDRARLMAEESVRIGHRINFPITQRAAATALRISMVFQGSPEPASPDDPDVDGPGSFRTPLHTVLRHWSEALSRRPADPGLAWAELKTALGYVQSVQYHAMATWLLPAAALLLADAGRAERATELLALAASHPLSPTPWIMHWPFVAETCERLRADLDDERYEVAWTRGQTLELQAVIHELLVEVSG